nr:uncharacterized protein LOC126518945 isoform X2 [Dermacentor andersoni]
MLCHHFYHCANSSQVPCLHHREARAHFRKPRDCMCMTRPIPDMVEGTEEKAIIGENTMRASAMDSGDANFWECSSRQLRLARGQNCHRLHQGCHRGESLGPDNLQYLQDGKEAKVEYNIGKEPEDKKIVNGAI